MRGESFRPARKGRRHRSGGGAVGGRARRSRRRHSTGSSLLLVRVAVAESAIGPDVAGSAGDRYNPGALSDSDRRYARRRAHRPMARYAARSGSAAWRLPLRVLCPSHSTPLVAGARTISFSSAPRRSPSAVQAGSTRSVSRPWSRSATPQTRGLSCTRSASARSTISCCRR